MYAGPMRAGGSAYQSAISHTGSVKIHLFPVTMFLAWKARLYTVISGFLVLIAHCTLRSLT